jgi:glycosyltransferase involved in cell wall biosynthesis
MRISLFHDLPSGGAKRTLHELTKRLAARHDVDAWALSTADERFCDLRPLVRTYRQIDHTPSRLWSRPFGRLNQLQRWRDLGRLVALSRRLAASIDAAGYDVVLAEPSMWTQAPPLLRWLATPSVYKVHEPPRALYEPGLNDRDGWGWGRVLDRIDPLAILYLARAKRLDRRSTRAAHRVLVNSRFTGEQVRRIYGIDPPVVYHGVDVSRFRPAVAGVRRREVVSVGALQPSKGFDFVVDALSRIEAGARPALRIIGNAALPREREYLIELAARMGVALEIELAIDDDQLARRYAEAALLVYAPHREPFGLAALEAMACATPVVAVAEGGLLESVRDQVTGLLVARDPRAFADAVRTLLDDEALRRRLGANGRDDVCARWTWEIAADNLERELAATARRPDARRASA